MTLPPNRPCSRSTAKILWAALLSSTKPGRCAKVEAGTGAAVVALEAGAEEIVGAETAAAGAADATGIGIRRLARLLLKRRTL